MNQRLLFLAVRTGLELIQSRKFMRMQYADNNQLITDKQYY